MKRVSLLMLSMFAFAYLGMGVWPDIAPPQYPGGGDPGPDSAETRVRMLSERVVISVRMNTSMDMVYANVDAVFWMRNEGEQDERMEVYFPALCFDDEEPQPIQNFKAQVNGKQVPTRYKSTALGARPSLMTPVVFDEKRSDLCSEWYTFDVTFPVREPVVIRVTYTLQSTPYGRPVVTFRYRLDTGSEWWKTIGQGNILLRLPYEARIDNAWVYPQDRHRVAYKDGVLRVDFEDLEPTSEDNLRFVTIVPSLWYPVVAAERALQKNPRDGEAWGRLAKALKSLIWRGKFDAIQTEYQAETWPKRVTQAYANAVKYRPADPLWHLGFAEWLWYCYTDYVEPFLTSCRVYPPEEGLRRAIEETYRAYTLAPNHPKVRKKLKDIAYMMAPYVIVEEDGTVIFQALTPTPEAQTQTPSATPTPSPTATSALDRSLDSQLSQESGPLHEKTTPATS